MRLARLLIGLVLLLPVLSLSDARAQALSPMPGSFTPAQRQEIIDIIRNALKQDPTILRDAVAALRDDEGARQQAATRSTIASMSAQLIATPGDPVAGNQNGDVTVVEFYDVRCPYCRRMLPVMANLLKADRGVRVVYKDIPVLGPASVTGARAVLAAQKQGAYLKMREALMTGGATIDQDTLRATAQKLGLDWPRLQRDMDDPGVQARIDANLKLARALQIEGTPGYVIGGELLPGAVELADLKDAVALARKR
jgi:protein-disulfide isomerase